MKVKYQPNAAQKVTDANKRFYDQIAQIYEKVDSRRSSNLSHAWLDSLIQQFYRSLQKSVTGCSSLSMLDAGSGSGFLAYRSQDLFNQVILLDLSVKMLEKVNTSGIKRIVGDCTHIPLSKNSVHFIGAFATLHHLFSPFEFFKQAFYTLKKDGILYTDHDIEFSFVRNYRLPLNMYRFFFDHGLRFIKLCPTSKMKDYELSEFHGKHGLDGEVLTKQLKDIGFQSVQAQYHWNGMGPFETALDRLRIKTKLSKKGHAPNLRIIAIK